MIKNLKSISLITLLLLSHIVNSQVVFSENSSFKYLKGNEAGGLPANWMNAGFDDSSWLTANAPFRYGDGTGGTELLDMNGNYSAIFLRSDFTLENLSEIEHLIISTDWDDGFILWINGERAHSSEAPATVTHNATASGLHESGSMVGNIFNPDNLNLIEGLNTIAVIACNYELSGSSDFFFDMSISKQLKEIELPNLPEIIDSVGLSISHPSGFYNANFNLTISTPVAGANIIYTLDGSNPQKSRTSITGGASETININPSSTSNRGATPAVVVRASIIKNGFNASKPTARTFIYIDNVKTQTHPGGDWPTYNPNGQVMDFDMDSKIVDNSEYSNYIDDALLDIPTISVITDNANLFDPATGIYVNARGKGTDWERECSVELINPDNSDGFNVNAGLRIRGRASRSPNAPKHSFRLFFREEYGNSKLNFALFGDEGVSKFDKIDLRCAQNYAWQNHSPVHNTFVREVFTRDAQGETGQPYTRSRYYHLYLNGMYWGLYQTQERSEARFSADYLGGDKEDYDVIKIKGENPDPRSLKATDGTMDKWEDVYNLTQEGFETNTKYFHLEGKDLNGRDKKDSEVFVDIDNLIDYMINIFYTGNFDSPITKWPTNNGGNVEPNNMYAICNRENKSHGFKFYVHDAEHSLLLGQTSGSPGIGLHENRVNIGDLNDVFRMEVQYFRYFHPQWIHYKLSKNKEYRVRFANRAYEQLTGNGIFTPAKNLERFNKRASQIEMAIIAESARWGDFLSFDYAFSKNDNWITELNQVRNRYFPYRTNIVINQLKDAGLYPNIDAPFIQHSGDNLEAITKINTSMEVKITNPASNGVIYYTVDGNDPRMVLGEIRNSALTINSGETITVSGSMILKARIFYYGEWSALKEVSFIKEQTDFSMLKVTELHYHPLNRIEGTDTISDKSYEFIEFRNTDMNSAINLSGLVIDSAIYYEFPENTILLPQKYYVVAAKPAKFYERYGKVPSGNYKNSFSNGGERVVVFNSNGESIIDFTYSDDSPWPSEADGDGPSLTSVENNPTGNPNNYEYWKSGSHTHGTPFIDDELNTEIKQIPTEFAHNSFLMYPNPTNNEVIIHLTSKNTDNSSIVLYNLSGSIIHSEDFTNSATISLLNNNIPYGMYIVKVTTGNNIENRKLIYAPY